jgi:myo-inositol 2-dehydrogenase / D-chiro-inositol 1-dehydrogenase
MKTGSKHLAVCVVGAGRIGKEHIERLAHRIVGAEVRVVVDVNVARANQAIETIPSAVAVSDIERALDGTDVDAVLIATPGFLHEQILVEARERDLPILCEKPLTPMKRLLGGSWRWNNGWERNASRSVLCGGLMPDIRVYAS